MNNSSFCKNCGSPVQPGMNVCPSCGTLLNNQPMMNNNMPQQPSMFQQPMNGSAPQYQQPQVQQGNTPNVMGSAIGSLVCGIVAFFIFWWLSIVGIGFGTTAIKAGKAQNNKGAVILSIIGILICVADIVIFILGITGVLVIKL